MLETKYSPFVLPLSILSIIVIIGICTCFEFSLRNATLIADPGKDWKINRDAEPFQSLHFVESRGGIYDWNSIKLYSAPILSPENSSATNFELTDGKGRINISILNISKKLLRLPNEAAEDNLTKKQILKRAVATQTNSFFGESWSHKNITFNGRAAHLAEGKDWKGSSKGILAVELNTSVVAFGVTTDGEPISTRHILNQIRFNGTGIGHQFSLKES